MDKNKTFAQIEQEYDQMAQTIKDKGVGAQQKSIIDRCISLVYAEAKDTGHVPTLTTLREKLLDQPEPEAKQIALSLELYTTGSLDIFGKQSNVDLEKRIVVFDIHDLGTQLKPAGLLVITDKEGRGQDGAPDHVGIVEKVENGYVYTVEGNTGDSCREKSYALGYYEIFGYGTPAY